MISPTRSSQRSSDGADATIVAMQVMSHENATKPRGAMVNARSNGKHEEIVYLGKKTVLLAAGLFGPTPRKQKLT